MSQYDETKMDRTGFGEELCRQVCSLLGDGYQVELSQVRKNNGVMKEVLYVHRENRECVPCFYMEELYHSYCRGDNPAGLAEYLANIVLGECELVNRQSKKYLSKEWIVDRLFIRLVHLVKNKECLKDAVYVKYLDLAAVFHVLTEENEVGVKSFLLPRHIWDTLDLGTAEEYFSRAVENTQRLFPEKLLCMEQGALEGLLQGDELPESDFSQQNELLPYRLYAVSNHRRINGAAVLLYPEMLRQLGEKFSGNYYVIPSSIHEVLVIKETGEEDADRLNGIVREVNEQQVAPEEVLSDHVYFYSVEEGALQSREGA